MIDDVKNFQVLIESDKIENSLGHSFDPTGANFNIALAEVEGTQDPWVHVPTCELWLDVPIQDDNHMYIPVPSGVHLFGNGPEKTILKTDNDGGGRYFTPLWMTSGTTDIEFDNFSIDMNSKGSNAINIYGHNVHIHHMNMYNSGFSNFHTNRIEAGHTNFNFHDINSYNCGFHAFGFGYVVNGTFRNLYALNSRSGFDAYCRNCLFENITIENFIDLGMKVISGDHTWDSYDSIFRNIAVTNDTQINADCLKIYGNHNCDYENIYVKNGWNGVFILSGHADENNTFENIEIHDTMNIGFGLNGIGHTANNIRIYDSGSWGFYCCADNTTLSNFLVERAGSISHISECSDVLFRDSIIKDNPNNNRQAFMIGGTNNLEIDNITIRDNASYGLDTRYYNPNTNYTIHNCLIRDNGYAGICIAENDDYINIFDNIICNNNPNIQDFSTTQNKNIYNNVFVC